MDSIRIRRDVREAYNQANPYIELGEFAIVTDEFPTPIRIGDGEHRWLDLQEQYFYSLTEQQRQAIIKGLNDKIDAVERQLDEKITLTNKALADAARELQSNIDTVDGKMVVMTEREYEMLRYKDPSKFYFLYTGEGPTQYSYLDENGYLHVYGNLTGTSLSVIGTIRNKVLNLE